MGGSPPQRESWSIGIVQNVVFERLNFEYSDGRRFTKEFPDPILDSVATQNPPFIHDPVFIEACKLDPILSCKKQIRVQEPVINVFYTSKGYGETLDPHDPTGVAFTNKPDSVNMVDALFSGRGAGWT